MTTKPTPLEGENELDVILTKLENAVQHDLIMREQGRSGRSPKSIHAEARAAIAAYVSTKEREARIDEAKTAYGLVDIDVETTLEAIKERIARLNDVEKADI